MISNITFNFLCFGPLGLAIKLNFHISKVAYRAHEKMDD